MAIAQEIYAQALKKQIPKGENGRKENPPRSDQTSNNNENANTADGPIVEGSEDDEEEEGGEEEDEEDEEDKAILDKEFDQHQAKLDNILAMAQEANPEGSKRRPRSTGSADAMKRRKR